MGSATKRVTVSVGPPAENGTMNVMLSSKYAAASPPSSLAAGAADSPAPALAAALSPPAATLVPGLAPSSLWQATSTRAVAAIIAPSRRRQAGVAL
jgi:hypothetical protein